LFSHLKLPALADAAMPADAAAKGRRWTAAFCCPPSFPPSALAGTFVTPSRYLPQGITNQIVVWALVNALIALVLMPLAPKRASRKGIIGPSILIAIATMIAGYAALLLADLLFKVDFRFWIVPLKPMSAKQFLMFLIYLVPLTVFFVIALHVLHRNFSTMAAGRAALYLTNILALTLGFIMLLVVQYGALWLLENCSIHCPIPVSCRFPRSSPSSSCRYWRYAQLSPPSPGGAPAPACPGL
jgi:hypothetical protein